MRDNLIICPAGDNSLHKQWFVNDRTYDLMVIYYGDNPELINGTCDFVICAKGLKYELASKSLVPHFNNNPDFYRKYKYVWFPDSDIELPPSEIDKMFLLAKQRNAEIFQPSIANYLFPEKWDISKGWASWSATKTNTSTKYRRITHPESMMPGFSINSYEDIFIRSLVLFPQYRAGWGLECLWHVLSLSRHINKPLPHYIFDDIRAIHTKPVGEGSSEIHAIGLKEFTFYRNPYMNSIETLTLETFA